MKTAVDKALRRYGTQMKLIRGEKSLFFKGFFHHAASRSWQNLEAVSTPLGQIARGQYTLLAPASICLTAGDVLALEGRQYTVRRAETVMYGSCPLYDWVLCTERR